MKTKTLTIILMVACVLFLIALVAMQTSKDFPTPSGRIYTEPTIYQESVR